MDRQIAYTAQIPLETDILSTNKYAYIGLSKLAAAILGTSTLFNNLVCTATSPASLSVNISPGEIYSLQNIDNNAYSSLAADTVHQIVKQGINLNLTTLNCPAPTTSGNSVNYLIEFGFSEVDTGAQILPFYNSNNPNVPFTGPNNNGIPSLTIRQDSVNIVAKAGISAATGSQTTPSADAGFTGAYVVTVAYGQTTITASNISIYSGAPFITETLTQKLGIADLQSGANVYSNDTGTINAYIAALNPAITSYSAGQPLTLKIANTNTGASTLNINSAGVKNIKLVSGSAVNPGDLSAGQTADFIYDGTNFQLINPATLTSQQIVQSGTLNFALDTGSANIYIANYTPAFTSYAIGQPFSVKITNTNTGASTLNINSLGAKSIKLLNGNNPNAGDLIAGMIYDFNYDGTNLELVNPSTHAFNNQIFPDYYNYTFSGGV